MPISIVRRSVVSSIFSLGLALLPFGAVYKPELLGSFAASPGMGFILLAVFLATIAKPIQARDVYCLHLKFIVWLPVVSSLVSLSVFGYNLEFLKKFISVGILSILWISPLLIINYIRLKDIFLACLVGIGICILAYFISDALNAVPESMRSFIFGKTYTEYYDSRPRGFYEEPSHFTANLSRMVMIIYLIWESKRSYSVNRFLSFLLVTSIGLLLLGSKGAVIAIGFAVIASFIDRRRIQYIILAFPFALWLAYTQFDAIAIDYEQFSSLATRVTMLVAGLICILINPIGFGYYGFYAAIAGLGPIAIGLISENFKLNLSESEDIIFQLNNVSTKSTLLDFTIVFGWIFIWLMIKIVTAIRFNDPRVRGCWTYFVISAFTTSGHLSITFFLGLAILIKAYPQNTLSAKTY